MKKNNKQTTRSDAFLILDDDNKKKVKKGMPSCVIQYQDACNKLVKKMCEMFEIEPDQVFWVGDDIGDVISFYDYYLDMHNVYKVVVNGLNFDAFVDWYEQWHNSDNQQKVDIDNYKYLKNTPIKNGQ